MKHEDYGDLWYHIPDAYDKGLANNLEENKD